MALTDKLKAIADAIRIKTGKTDALSLEQMENEILAIPTGSSDVIFKFGGMNATHISHYYESWSLADTSFVIGTSASTSSTAIKASVANRYTDTTGSPTYAYGDNDIIVVQRCLITPTHSEGATGKAQQINCAYIYITQFSKRKTSDASANTTRQGSNETLIMQKYYNTSGTIARANASYGFYVAPQMPNTYSTTAASTYIRCGSPVLYYRASASYESTTNIKLVTDCTFEWSVDVYVVDKDTTPARALNDEVDDLFINGMGE